MRLSLLPNFVTFYVVEPSYVGEFGGSLDWNQNVDRIRSKQIAGW